MTLFPQAIGPIPEETRRVAWAANPKGTVAMRLRDALGTIYSDEDFRDLYPGRGQPALAPWRLAWVTILQYLEDLTDRQAAEAVRDRIDWKYTLGLELSDPGFDYSVLSEFRQRLLEQQAEQRLLDKLLQGCREQGWLKAGSKMRTDSTHVLAAVRCLHHLETVGETLRAALDDLTEVAGDWLLGWVPDDWFERYGERVENRRLPKKEEERRWLAEQIGRDGHVLLQALQQADAPARARDLESVGLLRSVWEQYYEEREGQVCWRDGPVGEAQETIVSPHDPEARIAQKRDTLWLGYKVHLTETCEPELPELVVQVKTTVAPLPDVRVTLELQQELEQRDLLPHDHLLDGGYVDATVLVNCPPTLRVLGPVPADTSWQARAGKGYDGAHFQVEWQQQRVTCPQGHQSRSWRERPDRGGLIQVAFAPKGCQVCPVRADCTQAQHRELQLQPQAQHEALQRQRVAQQRPDFRKRYALRSGVEATISQAVRRLPLRQSRYRGLSKVQLQEVLAATALNGLRIDAYLRGEPRGKTYISRFAKLKLRRTTERRVA